MRAILQSRALATLLLAVVLLGKLLVPGGWMPVQTDRGMAIMLCSGSGPIDAWLDSAGNLHKGKQPAGDSSPKDPCPFGAITAPADIPSAFSLPVLLPLPAAVPSLAAAIARIGQGLAAPPPPSTGPPLSV